MYYEIEQWHDAGNYKNYEIQVYVHPDCSCSSEIRNNEGEFVAKIDNCEDYNTALVGAKNKIDLL